MRLLEILKAIPAATPTLRFLQRLLARRQPPASGHTANLFRDIYRENRWGGQESRSGTGSDLAQTGRVIAELPRAFRDLGIRTVLDIPCGDFNWMKEVDLSEVIYTGADVVRELIRSNNRNFSSETIRFCHLDVLKDALPRVDLILCRDCLVHFSFEHIRSALENITASGSSFLMMTTFVNPRMNENIITGKWRPLNFQLAPFLFPEPLRMIDEHCTENGGLYRDKVLAVWPVSQIPHLACPPARTRKSV